MQTSPSTLEAIVPAFFELLRTQQPSRAVPAVAMVLGNTHAQPARGFRYRWSERRGKSTAAYTILPQRFRTNKFLNADEIARALAITSRIEAGRIMLERMHQLRDHRETFAFETTLAGKSNARFLVESRGAGYLVHLAYVWLSSVELAKKRVAVRGQRGGHDIPAEDIERRYWRGLRNFFELYQPLANRWVLCDNSGSRLVLVARGRSGQPPTISDANRFERIRHAAQQQ